MRKMIVVIMLLCVFGCIPTTQEIQTLTNTVDKLMVKVDNYQEKFAGEVDKVQDDIVAVNEAVKEKADSTALEQIEAGWEATKGFNPYYGYGALVFAGLEAAGWWRENKKKVKLEKGINRVKGEAEPELAKKIHDTIKIYTG